MVSRDINKGVTTITYVRIFITLRVHNEWHPATDIRTDGNEKLYGGSRKGIKARKYV